MTFRVRSERRSNTLGLDPTIWIVDDGAGTCIEAWPAHGFNCYRWSVYRERLHELLYSAANFFEDAKPTRSGIPVLFPFPNRIRAGRFSWDGKEYQLPVNDTPPRNAIHGFACRHPWRVIDVGNDEDSGWITGEFQASRDAPESLELWPVNYALRLTYRLTQSRLRLEANVSNLGDGTLPFGLGYHPYFSLPFLGDENAMVSVPASKRWRLDANLPDGAKLPLEGCQDLRQPSSIAAAQFDDIFTNLADASPAHFTALGSLETSADHSIRGRLSVAASASFREVVVFTPPHRQAICLEPYTCTTDAINLQQGGIEAGLLLLPAGETWQGVVEMTVEVG